MYQYTVILGNVGSDPELRYTQTGNAVCNISVAVTEKWKDAKGNPQERTTWYRVDIWGSQAEPTNQYVRKGDTVLVTGKVEASAWTDKDGNAKATLELHAQHIKFLGRRSAAGKQEQETAGENDIADIPF